MRRTLPTDRAPAPGTASVVLVVRSCDSAGDDYRCRAQINEVTAYGAGFPALPPKTEIDVRVPGRIIDEEKAGRLRPDAEFDALLRHVNTTGDPYFEAVAIR